MSSKKSTQRAGVLRNLPLIMIWRRTEDLKTAKAFGKDVVGWPKIGENDYAAMYDAGSALIAYWTQDEELAKDAVAAVAGGNACSGSSIIKYPLISNPASELVIAPTNVRSVMQKLKVASSTSNSNGEAAFSFVDEDGNYTRFIRPSESAFTGKAGLKLKSLLSSIRLENKRGAASKKVSQLVGYNLFVSDMEK